MSIFNGKWTRRGGVTAQVEDKTPHLTVTVTPKNDGPRASIRPTGGFDGAWERVGKAFSGIARPLAVLYRFLAYRKGVAVSHSAKASTAPTVAGQADNAVKAETSAQAASVPTVAAKLDRRERVSVCARAVAYALVLGRYVRGIAVGFRATPEAAPGAVAKYRRPVVIQQTAKATQSPGAIAESRKNKIPTAAVVAGQFAVTVPGSATMDAKAELTAAATTVYPVAGVVDTRINVTFTAKGAYWFYPEVVDGVLILRQAYSASKNGNILEVR